MEEEVKISGIGGSDIAACLGLSQFETALEAFMRLTGMLPPKEETVSMRRGRRLEPLLAQEYEEVTGKRLVRWQREIRLPGDEWARATFDYLIEGEPVGVEIKATGSVGVTRWGVLPDEDSVPDEYFVQCQWYLMFPDPRTGQKFSRWDIALGVWGEELRIYSITPNEELHQVLLEEGRKFWKRVLEREPPPLDVASGDLYLRIKYPEHRSPIREATAEEIALAERLRVALTELKVKEEEVARLEIALKERIGDGEGIRGPFGEITWRKARDSRRIDWESLAKDLCARLDIDPEQEAGPYTSVTPGARRFVKRWR